MLDICYVIHNCVYLLAMQSLKLKMYSIPLLYYYTSIACIVAHTYLLNPVSNSVSNQLDIDKESNIVS